MTIDLSKHDNLPEQMIQQGLSSAAATNEASNELELEQGNAQIREAIYSFLSSIYLQPVTEETLRYICDDVFLSDLPDVLPGEATLELKNYLASLNVSSLGDELEELKQEYMSLFAVPTGRYVTPFEDIYRGKTPDGQFHRGPLLGVRAIAAKQLYREAGAQMDSVCKQLPNHIGVELSFMHFLCGREALALNNNVVAQEDGAHRLFSQANVYLAYQVRFLSEHLMSWFPQLNEEIQNKSEHIFYRALSNITQNHLQQDLADLEQLLKNSMQ